MALDTPQKAPSVNIPDSSEATIASYCEDAEELDGHGAPGFFYGASMPDETDTPPPIFAFGTIQSGYELFKGAPELQFPSASDQAEILERISVSALTEGMVIPQLRFDATAPRTFESLLAPTAYYVVGATGNNLNTTLNMAYETNSTRIETNSTL